MCWWCINKGRPGNLGLHMFEQGPFQPLTLQRQLLLLCVRLSMHASSRFPKPFRPIVRRCAADPPSQRLCQLLSNRFPFTKKGAWLRIIFRVVMMRHTHTSCCTILRSQQLLSLTFLFKRKQAGKAASMDRSALMVPSLLQT